jgi:hypothetical protein
MATAIPPTQADILNRINPGKTQTDSNGNVAPAPDSTNQKSNAGTDSASRQASNRATFFRTPFTMDCLSWRQQTPAKSIVFRCNPNSAAFEWPIRGATQKIKSGNIYYWWRNRDKGSHFDVPTVTFGFQSGNIAVMKYFGQSQKEQPQVYLPKGLDNFYQFMALYDEKKILADGTPNFVTITHHSQTFPNLTLTGFFDVGTPVTITDNTDNISEVSWSAKFFIHTSSPRFNSANFAQTFGTVFENYKPGNP